MVHVLVHFYTDNDKGKMIADVVLVNATKTRNKETCENNEDFLVLDGALGACQQDFLMKTLFFLNT